MTKGGRCWYCGNVGVALTDEHVLSEANFGGRLVARDAVCGRCNRMVGALERNITLDAFLAYLVGRHAPAYAPRNGPHPMAKGVLEDGTNVRVAFTPDGPRIASRRPRRSEVRADGTEVWDVLAGAEERVRERLAQKGIRATVRPHSPSETPGLNIKWGIGPPNVANWSRLCAKVALSLASLVVGPGWLDTPGARALQDVLHERPWDAAVLGRDLPFGPGPADPQNEPAYLLARPRARPRRRRRAARLHVPLRRRASHRAAHARRSSTRRRADLAGPRRRHAPRPADRHGDAGAPT